MNKPITHALVLCFLAFFSSFSAFAQDQNRVIQLELDALIEGSSLSPDDVSDWIITDQYTSEHNQITHVYIRQRHQGVDVFNAVANFNIKNSKVLNMNHDFIAGLASRINTTSASVSAADAVRFAMQHLNIEGEFSARILKQDGQSLLFDKGNISLEDIPVVPMYQPMPEGEVRLAWDLSIYMMDAHNWWSIRVDAQNGAILHKNNWVVDCAFDHDDNSFSQHNHTQYSPALASGASGAAVLAPDQYNVFALPVESPIHGPRSLLLNPADSIASPFGWHDTNGIAGADYTITRGNNVLASEDRDADNVPGYSPDAGASLDFDFPLNTNQQPIGYEDAAITNLFYMNNMMHDVWYHYGFTEASGNFQHNNYGNGGLGDDFVVADAQDGGGVNNANFGTPPDGSNPRMQMFLWTSGGGLSNYLQINSPAGIAGAYAATGASFGPGVPLTPITADLVIVEDTGGLSSTDACDPIVNGANVNGKIAMIDRGDCSFVFKIEAAQNAGALAVIIVNNVSTAPITMGGSSASITIPSIMISQSDGDSIKAAIIGGAAVNGSIQDSTTTNFDLDGDFDNGIIAHEYGHGISNRLTGGPANSSCLGNAEQMGEGWSDFFSIVMTMEASDVATDLRGVGTFVLQEPVTGNGIRPAPYTTDTTINGFTYASTNNSSSISQPHGIGFVWCTMLWDLTWAFIDVYGYDADLSYGSGGNNMVMQLVMDGLKLQPCNPGFVDGRDAILAADQALYGGAHQCLIWEVFAQRGLGFSASQGSSSSRTDQVEAFDLPNICLTPEAPPIADFAPDSLNTCYSKVDFEDQSTDIPQQWNWDFGDGNTSSVQNPSHTYGGPGVYTVTLIVSNTLGSDTATAIITITAPQPPVAAGGDGCFGDSVQLSASASGEIRWLDSDGNKVGEGSTFWTPALDSSTTFFAVNADTFPSAKIGPADNTIGTGGYHGTTFIGTVNFTAHQPLVILSAWVDAAYAGPRDFFLWSGTSASGSVLQQVTIDIPFSGPGRVDVGFEVPSSGDFSIGASGVDMYRNNSGAAYPYEIPGLMTITSSSAVSGPEFYYYLYDLEVAQAPCLSSQVAVVANIDSNQCEPFAFSTMVTGTSVRLNWVGQDECNYRYQIRGRAINTSTWTVIEVSAGSPDFLDVSNLPSNVTYEWQIRAYCSSTDANQISPWSNLDLFTTICTPPDSIWTDSLTSNSVQLRWSEVPGAFGYEVSGGVLGSSSIVKLVIAGQVTKYDVSGLSPNTSYRWAVKTFCSANGSKASGISYIDTFATLASKNLSDQVSATSKSMEVSVSPNPFAEECDLRISQIPEGKSCLVEVFDATGRRVFFEVVNGESAVVKIGEGLGAGLYQYRVRGGEVVFVGKIFKL